MPDLEPPDAPAWSSRRCRVVVGAAVVVYLAYSSFGFLHPVLWGHYGFHTAEHLMRATASLRFGHLVPYTTPGFLPPPTSDVYLHYPIGFHVVLTLLVALLGNHAAIGTALGVAGGLLVIAALHALVAAIWSRRHAAIAVVAWVALPLVWSFSILTDARTSALACALVLTSAWLRYLQQPSRRLLVLGAIAAMAGALLTWDAAFQAALLGALALAHRPSRGIRWCLVTGGAIALTGALHVALVASVAHGGELVESFHARREASAGFTLGWVAHWLMQFYGPVALAVLGTWLVLLARRLARGRGRLRDFAIASFALVNLLSALLFPRMVAVHGYAVTWCAATFVLAAVDVVAQLDEHPDLHRARPWLVLVTLLAVLPLSVRNLVASRREMGAHGTGAAYDADYAKMLFADEVARRTGPGDLVGIATSLPHRLELLWHLDRSRVDRLSLATLAVRVPAPSVLLAADDAPGDADALARLRAEHPVLRFVVGDRAYLMVDRRRRGREEHVMRCEPRVMTRAWRWFVSTSYPPVACTEAPGR